MDREPNQKYWTEIWRQQCRQYNLQILDDYWQMIFWNDCAVLQRLSRVFCQKVKRLSSLFVAWQQSCFYKELKLKLKTGEIAINSEFFWMLLHRTRWNTRFLLEHCSGNYSSICGILSTKWNDSTSFLFLYQCQVALLCSVTWLRCNGMGLGEQLKASKNTYEEQIMKPRQLYEWAAVKIPSDLRVLHCWRPQQRNDARREVQESMNV
jgi:hypothetical protein